MVFCLLLSSFPINLLAIDLQGEFDIDIDFDFLHASSYSQYRQEHINETIILDHIIEVDSKNIKDSYSEPIIIENFEQMPGYTILTGETGFVEFSFYVEYQGLYNIYLEYFPIEGRGNDIERRFLINGEIPFNHAAFFIFHRFWAKSEPIQQDQRGNDLRPSLVEVPKWSNIYLSDYLGYVNEPYLFFFKQGENTIRIESSREPMAIRRLILKASAAPEDYANKSGVPYFACEPIGTYCYTG